MNNFSENEVKKYIIIGNGFDLNLGIKSSYNDFVTAVSKQFQLNTLEEVYQFNSLFVKNFNSDNLGWSDFETVFENQVVEINSQHFEKEDEARRRYLINKLNQDLSNLEDLFYDYLSNIYSSWKNSLPTDLEISPVYREIFSGDASIVSFNFTNTVKDIFKNVHSLSEDKFFQVHGSLDTNNILFGGGFSGTEKVTDIYIEGSMDNDKLIRIKKNQHLVKIREKFRNSIFSESSGNDSPVDLYIIGHSVDGSDLAFLAEIFEKARQIYLFYYREDFLPKLQSLTKKLGKDITEKIVLVPFFDILVEPKGTNQLILSDSLEDSYAYIDKGLSSFNQNHIQKFFDFPVPNDTNGEKKNAFANIVVSSDSFIFESLKNLNLESYPECQSFLDLLNGFPPEKLIVNSNSYMTIKGISNEGEDNILNQIFTHSNFRNIVKNISGLRIEDAPFSLDAFIQGFGGTQLKRLDLIENVIEFSKDLKLDLTIFAQSENITIKGNAFKGEEGLRLAFYSSKKEVAGLKTLVLADNENTVYDASLYHFAKNCEVINLPYPMDNKDDEISDEIINFSKAEHVTIKGRDDEDTTRFKNLIFGAQIEELHLENVLLTEDIELESGRVTEHPQNLAKLFDTRILPNLRILSFTDCDMKIADYPIDFYTDFINHDIVIRIDSKNYLVNNLLFGRSIDDSLTSAVPHQKQEKPEEETFVQGKTIEITEEVICRIEQFANDWGLDRNSLRRLVEQGGDSKAQFDNAMREVKDSRDFDKYRSNGGQFNKVKYKVQAAAATEKFIKELRVNN